MLEEATKKFIIVENHANKSVHWTKIHNSGARMKVL